MYFSLYIEREQTRARQRARKVTLTLEITHNSRLTPRLSRLMEDTRLVKYSVAVFDEGYVGIEDLLAATGEIRFSSAFAVHFCDNL